MYGIHEESDVVELSNFEYDGKRLVAQRKVWPCTETVTDVMGFNAIS
jgi:hypothetical protein